MFRTFKNSVNVRKIETTMTVNKILVREKFRLKNYTWKCMSEWFPKF